MRILSSIAAFFRSVFVPAHVTLPPNCETGDNTELLGAYIDLMNEHGIASPHAKAFRKKHAHNRELMKLVKNAGEVSELYRTGWLKPTN